MRELSPRGAQGTARRAPRAQAAQPPGALQSWCCPAWRRPGVLAALAFGVVQVYTRVSRSAIAPDVVGLSVGDAQTLARREGLNWQQTDINHDTIPAGTVISQIPEPDTAMEKGDSLLVAVSLGPVSTAMPDLNGMNYEDATARLKDRGFGNIVLIKTVSSSPVGTVLGSKPQGGRKFHFRSERGTDHLRRQYHGPGPCGPGPTKRQLRCSRKAASRKVPPCTWR